MEVVIYSAVAKKEFDQVDRIPVNNLTEARTAIREMFRCLRADALWNVRSAYMALTGIEAHILGWCADEYIAIILEDNGESQFMQEDWR